MDDGPLNRSSSSVTAWAALAAEPGVLDVFGHGDLPAGGRSCLLDVLKPQTRVFLVTTAVDRLLDRLLLPGRTEPPLFGGSFWSGTVPRSLCTLRSPRSADIFRSVDGVCYAPDEAERIP